MAGVGRIVTVDPLDPAAPLARAAAAPVLAEGQKCRGRARTGRARGISARPLEKDHKSLLPDRSRRKAARFPCSRLI